MSARLEFHPIAELFPLMSEAELAALTEDIRRHGLLEPIVLHEGRILDGRNRYLACRRAGVAVRTRELPAEANPWDYVWSANAERRHLDAGRKAQIRVRQLARSDEWRRQRERAKVEANRRRSEATKKQPRTADRRRLSGVVSRDTAPEGVPAPQGEEKDRARQREATARRERKTVAVAAKVSEPTAARALALERKRPDLADKVIAGELTQPQALRQMQRDQRRAELARKAQQAAADAKHTWRIVEGDCIEQLEALEAGSARLVFADPPYNIGIDYGDGPQADRLPDEQYLAWCQRWMRACLRVLTPDGSLWVMIGDEYAGEYACLLKRLGLSIRNWIKWYETFGVNCTNKFNRCSRHIFYCVRDPRRFVFNAEAVSRPSDRQRKYGDKRADPGGKVWDDVWTIPRLVGTSAERIPDFPTQIPLAITRAIVGCASDPGDLVIDPFAGSASTGVAAIELGRRFIGIEKNRRFCELARLRLKAASATPSAGGAGAKAN